MRLLHTSDWHLGRTLHGVDLLDHQAAFLDHLVTTVREEQVDAVLVAGDVYDRAIPPVEAVTLLSDALTRLAEQACVIITSGNHDSAVRLGFGASLLRERVRVRTRIADLGRPVQLADADGAVLVYGLPYLDPDVARRELGPGAGAAGEIDDAPGAPDAPDYSGAPDEADLPAPSGAADRSLADSGLLARSHAAVLGEAMRRVRTDLAVRRAAGPARAVVMAHAFVVGGQVSESERDIRVGGVDSVPAAVFDGVDYVALGHLHGPQVVHAGSAMRYAGSPLAYSFSEARQTKSTVLVDLAADGAVRTQLVPAPVPRRLTDLTGPLDELLGAAGAPYAEDWVRVTVTDDARPVELYRQVRERFPHALVVQHRPAGGAAPSVLREVTSGADPVGVAEDFVRYVTDHGPGQAELAALRAAFERVAAEERG